MACPSLDYPLADDVKLVRSPGVVVFSKHARCYLTQALVGERVGVREIEDYKWLITYATLDLGVYDAREDLFEPLPPETKICVTEDRTDKDGSAG